MRDPHVEQLHFTVSSGKDISYDNPPSVRFSSHHGAFDMQCGCLVVRPAAHFADEEEACRVINPFLRAWEAEADLRQNVGTIRFTFERAELVDRDPPPPGEPQVFHVGGAITTISLVDCVTPQLIYAKYPDPPNEFCLTPDAESAYRRWMGFMEGREPLQSMAYFILTLLETTAGGREKAVRLYAVERIVLSAVGKFASTKGDAATARKAHTGSMQALSGREQQWLLHTVRRLIRRLGEHGDERSLQPIRMSDLSLL